MSVMVGGTGSWSSCLSVSSLRANRHVLTLGSPRVLLGCLVADKEMRMGMQRPDVVLRPEGVWSEPAQEQMLQLLLHHCSTSVPSTAQETKTVAVGTAQHSMQNPRAPRGPKQGWATFASHCFCCKFALRTFPLLFSVLLSKVPAAEAVQEPGSVQGPRPHCLHWRSRRTLLLALLWF